MTCLIILTLILTLSSSNTKYTVPVKHYHLPTEEEISNISFFFFWKIKWQILDTLLLNYNSLFQHTNLVADDSI